MSLKPALSDLLNYMLDQHLAFGTHLTDTERAEMGAEDNWSAKDALFHSMVWADRHLNDLESWERDSTWSEHDYGNFNAANNAIFLENQHRSWAEAEELIRNVYTRINAYVDRTDEEHLVAVPSGQNQPVWRSIAGNYVLHPMIHLWEYLQKHNHLDPLIDMFGETFTDLLLAVHDSGEWRALTFYNQACIYGQAGKTTAAIEQLAKALQINPSLTEWSKHDPDLNSLREDPAYQALYPRFKIEPDAMSAYDLFSHWTEVRWGLMAALDLLEDEQLKFVPREGMRSLGEVVCHIANAEAGWFHYSVRHELDKWPDKYQLTDYPTVQAVKDLLTETHDHTIAYLKTVDAADLDKPMPMPRGPNRTLLWVTWHVLEHEIHHRGEVFLMLGLLGLQAPDI